MEIKNINIKENSLLAKIAAWKMKSRSIAMVLGQTIHLYKISKEEFLADEKWVRHELCHLQQFKEHGTVGFIARYLWESIRNGYHHNKFEKEARNAE